MAFGRRCIIAVIFLCAMRSFRRRFLPRANLFSSELDLETGFAGLHPPPPSLPKPATDSSLAEKPFLRPFLACGGLRFPVSARRPRLRAPFGGPVSGGKNPVPNSIWRRVPDEMHGIYAGKIFRSQSMTIKTAAGRVRSPSDLPRADRPAIRPASRHRSGNQLRWFTFCRPYTGVGMPSIRALSCSDRYCE